MVTGTPVERHDHVERRVLGGLLQGADPGDLTADDFSSIAFRGVFRAILTSRERDGRVNVVAVSARIEGKYAVTLLAELLNEERLGSFKDDLEALRCASIRRRLGALGRDVADAAENGSRETLDLLQYLQGEVGGLTKRVAVAQGMDLLQISKPGRYYLDTTIPRPPFLIDGILHAGTETDGGSVGLLAGRPSSGKTWIALEAAKSVAGGTPFYGIPTVQGKVGLVLLESTAWQVQERLRALGPGDWLDQVFILSVTELGMSHLDLLDAALQDAVVRWAQDKALLILDPLAFLHTLGDLNSEERAIPLMGALKSVARKGHVAVLAIHHSRKESTQAQKADDAIDMVRGSGALTAAAGVVLGVREVQNRIRLEVGKSQASATAVTDLWLNWSDPDSRSGPVVLTEAPESQSDAKEERVEAVVNVLSVHGRLDREGVHEALVALGHDVKPDTIWRYLNQLVKAGRVRKVGRGPATTYELISDAETHPRSVRDAFQVIGKE